MALEVGAAWQTAFADTDAGGRRCLSCGNPSAAVQVGDSEAAVGSMCTSCQLTWFDAAAWAALPHRPPDPPKRSRFASLPPTDPAPPPEPPPPSSIPTEPSVRPVPRPAAPDPAVDPLPPLPSSRANDPAQLRGHFEPLSGTDPTAFSYARIPGVAASRGLVTWGVVASLAVVGALTLPLPSAETMFGFKPGDPLAGAGLPLIVSFYVHASLGHLLVNLYFLAAMGDRVEAMLGTRRYLSTLLAGTVLGSLAYALGGPSSVAPMVGSGAGISAVIVLYAFSAPRARVSFLIFYDSPRLSVWSFLGIWVLVQIVGDFALWGAGRATPFSLQLAGALVGILAWFGVLFEAPSAEMARRRATRS